MELMTVGQLAKRAGIPNATIYGWLKCYPLKTTLDSDGVKRCPPETLELLKQIRALSQEGKRQHEIKALLFPTRKHESVSPPLPTDLELLVVATVNSVLNQMNELAFKYGDSMRELGYLKAMNEEKERQLLKLRTKRWFGVN